MKRLLTSALLIPFITYVILWSPQWAFLSVLTAVALLSFYEFGGLVAQHSLPAPGLFGYAAGLLVLLAPGVTLPLVSMVVILALALAMRAADLSETLPHAATLVLGILYIFGGWRFASSLRAFNAYWLLLALALNWAGDAAAYYVGRKWGRHRLSPRVSPAKSWEGAVASLAASLILAAIYAPRLLPEFALLPALGIVGAGNIAGQIGDLCESALKRGARVKDSGTLLPGHGGWLDRVDSALFTLPVVYFLVSRLA